MHLLKKIWHWVRWPLAVLVVFYILIVLYRIPAVGEQQRTQETVAKIHAQKITLSDVMGNVLPPVPNKEENEATVAGIDKNNNGIRDDVELAIFALHPNSAKIRAAELQYAMAIQLMLTEVFNNETWIAAAKETSRGDLCISLTYPRNNLQTYLKVTEERSKEVKDLVLNTSIRNQAWDEAYNYTKSFALPNTDLCNIDLNTLSN